MKNFQFLPAESLTAIIWICCIATSWGADVTVEGVTYNCDSGGNYRELPGVRVQAFRGGGPIFPTPVISDSTGRFHISVPPGIPFTVSFSADDSRVPEVQELAAKDGVQDNVSVAVLTVQQYQILAQAGSVMPLRSKLDCVLHSLPEGAEASQIARQILTHIR